MTLVIDVETVPLAASLAAPYPDVERLPPANYKNPEAIASWREKDRATWAEQRSKECSLTPRLGRIVCLGWAQGDLNPNCFLAANETDEKALLQAFWDVVAPMPQLVTFNGSFDLRFIVVRSMVHGLLPPKGYSVAAWFQRYRTSPHFDCRAVLTGWDDRQTGKLGEWCQTFGITHNDDITSADISAYYDAKNFDAIATHCRDDVTATRTLYQRIAPMFT